MKNFFFILLAVFAFSCSSQPTRTSAGGDSMNGINNNGIEDTSVSPIPDGYAPPNAKIDTSQATKDSIEQRKK